MADEIATLAKDDGTIVHPETEWAAIKDVPSDIIKQSNIDSILKVRSIPFRELSTSQNILNDINYYSFNLYDVGPITFFSFQIYINPGVTFGAYTSYDLFTFPTKYVAGKSKVEIFSKNAAFSSAVTLKNGYDRIANISIELSKGKVSMYNGNKTWDEGYIYGFGLLV